MREFVAAFNASPAGLARAELLATNAAPPPLAIIMPPPSCNCPMVDQANPNATPYASDPLIRTRFALDNKQLFRALFHRDALLMTRNMFIYM